MFLLDGEDGMRKGPMAGGSLEFQELEEDLSGWESQSKGKIARNEAGAVGGATPTGLCARYKNLSLPVQLPTCLGCTGKAVWTLVL